MEALQSLALKQAFVHERNKIAKHKLKEYGPGFSFRQARFAFSKYYKETEYSKILERFFGHMELCYCGEVFETDDYQHYKSKPHQKFVRDYGYCDKCESYELRYRHPCFNPICECGEEYHILSDYYHESVFRENHKFTSAKHHYYMVFGPDY
jgi:hypothetical protein